MNIWVDCFGTLLIPSHLRFHARKDGLLDRRYTRQNAEFKRWLGTELRRLRGVA